MLSLEAPAPDRRARSDRADPLALGVVQRTLLVPLWARATEQSMSRPLLCDPLAPSVLAALRWDPSVLRGASASRVGCCVRAAWIDAHLRALLRRSPDAAVLELGVGLNTRHARVPAARCFEVDFDDVLALRERVLPAAREGGVTRVAGDLRDPAARARVARVVAPGAVAVLEGVLVYLDEGSVRSVLRWLFDELQVRAALLDCMAPIVERLQGLHDAMRHFDARFTWSLPDVRALERWCPAARVASVASFYDLLLAQRRRLPGWMSLAAPLVERAYPTVRDAYRVVLLERRGAGP